MHNVLPMLALYLLSVAFSAMLGWHTHKVAGVQVWIPDNWKIESQNNYLAATSPDDEVYVGYIVSTALDMDATLDNLETQLRTLVQDAKFDKSHDDFTINGMPAWGFGGTGTHDGQPVEMRIELIFTPKKKVLILVAVSSHTGLERHLDEVKQMMRSVRKA
ncbi:MAG: hypothetical protein ACK41G_00445 [Candidatus Thermochlorobacter sp.]